MELTPITERFILHWGEMGSRWGVNRSVAQIHALLYIIAEPLEAEEIASTLGIARSNVSQSIKELLAWDLVHVVHIKGNRREHFASSADVWELFKRIVAGRRQREIDPTIKTLRECLDNDQFDKETDGVRERLADTLHFMETMNTLADEMLRFNPETLMKLFGMSAKVSRFIRKD